MSTATLAPTLPRQPFAVLLAASLLSAAGALLFNVMPAFLGACAEQFQLNDEQVGWLGSAYLGGFALLAASSPFWIGRVCWRRLCLIASICAGAALAASSVGGGYASLLACLALTGAGCGAIYTVAIAVVAENHNPDRAFAIKLSFEIGLGVLMLFSLPELELSYRALSFLLAAVLLALGVGAAMRTPHGPSEHPAELPGGGFSAKALAPWVGLFALFLAFGAMTALWAFLERVGPDFGLDSATAARILTVSLLLNGVSALAVAVVGTRFGRALPLAVGMLMTLAGVAALMLRHDLYGYVAGTLLTVGLWNIAFSFQMGLIASADITGKVAVLIPAAVSIGGALGPGIAGTLAEGGSYTPIYLLVGAATAISLVIFLALARRLSQFDVADTGPLVA